MGDRTITRATFNLGATDGKTILEAQREAAVALYGAEFFDVAAVLLPRLPLNRDQVEAWVLDAFEARAWNPWIYGHQVVAPNEGTQPFGARYTAREIVAAGRRLATTFDTSGKRLLLVSSLISTCAEIRRERVARHLEEARSEAKTVRELPATTKTNDGKRTEVAAELAFDVATGAFAAGEDEFINELNRRVAMTDAERKRHRGSAARTDVPKSAIDNTIAEHRVEATPEMLRAADERRRALRVQAERLAAAEGDSRG